MMSGSISAEDTEGESVLASPLALGGLLAGFGILSLQMQHPNLCLHVHMMLSPECTSMSKFPLLISHQLYHVKGPTYCNITLSSCIFRNSIFSNKVTF